MVKSEWIAVANWKMNLPPEGIEAWIRGMSGTRPTTVGVAPSFPFLPAVDASRGRLKLVAQNCASESEGAYTGEVSASMLAHARAEWVILGHSERRNLYGESPALVGKKVVAALAAKLVPILCIGEKQEVRERGETNALLRVQLLAGLEGVDRSERLIVAYEPVWAIGTGKTATSEIVQETHSEILVLLESEGFQNVPLLYGGSVTADNAPELSLVEGVNGFLVGGASLSSVRFGGIVDALDRRAGAFAEKG